MLDWVTLKANGAFVVQTQLLVAGKVVEFFDGVEKVYHSTENNQPVTAPVVKLDSGHALMANGSFIVMTERESLAFHGIQTVIGTVLAECVKQMAEGEIDQAVAYRLLLLVLNGHSVALQGAIGHVSEVAG